MIILPRELRGLLLQFCKKKRLTTGRICHPHGKAYEPHKYMVHDEETVRTSACGFPKSVSAQSQTPVCAHFLPNGKGYRPPGGYSGTFKYRNNEDIYTYKQYRARKSDLPPPFVDLNIMHIMLHKKPQKDTRVFTLSNYILLMFSCQLNNKLKYSFPTYF